MGKPGRPAGRVGGETKRKIIAVSISLFSSTSVDATSIRHIMKSLDMNEASFYNHFKSKDNLVETVISIFYSKMAEMSSTPEIELPLDIDPKAYFKNDFLSYLETISASTEYRDIWFIISAEQYKRESAAECIFLLTNHFVTTSELLLKQMTKIGLIQECDEKLVAEELIYGFRALQLEYLLISHFGRDLTITIERVNTHIDFCLAPYISACK